MPGVLDLADRLWWGEVSIKGHHPVGAGNISTIEEVTDGVAFVPSFANVSVISAGDAIVLVDTGSAPLARVVHEQVRHWTPSRLDTAIYSHGHIDHVFGVPVFEEEARDRKWPTPRVVAHEALPARFDRYVMTAGYNGIINTRQFNMRQPFEWPTAYRYPDETYRDELQVDVGDVRLQLHHARGETDDHTWTWFPDKRVLFCGDLFIWASPNAGNPQKVQRYPKEWAEALRRMVALGAEYLLPGHGLPVVGADRVAQALGDTAELLESLHDQTLALMNQGARLNDILHSVQPPAELMGRPYLQPVYDEPEFVVRNIWRLYGGWYDGNPAELKPARSEPLARELASLAEGTDRLVTRASEVSTEGDHRLACHLVELAWQADPSDARVRDARAEVYGRRVAVETSTMAKGIYSWAVTEAQRPPAPEV